MTASVNMVALAERIELADGPDRRLDGLTRIALDPDEKWIVGQEPGNFPRKPIYGTLSDYVEWMQAADAFDAKELASALDSPEFTGSLDSARSAWPEGWFIRVTQVRFGMWQVEGWRGDKSVNVRPDIKALAGSEERARLAAALRARATEKSDGE